MNNQIKKKFIEIDSTLGTLRGIWTTSELKNDSVLIFVSGYSQLNNPHLGRNRRIADEIFYRYSIDSVRFDFNGVGESDGSLYELNSDIMTENLRDVYKQFKSLYKNVSFITMSYGSNILRRFIYEDNISAFSTLMLSPVFNTIREHFYLKIQNALFTDYYKIKEKKYLELLEKDFDSNNKYELKSLNLGRVFSFIGSDDFDFNINEAQTIFKKHGIDFEKIDGVNHGLAFVGQNNVNNINEKIKLKIIEKIGGLHNYE